MSSGKFQQTVAIEEFGEQIDEILQSVQSILDNTLPSLKGTQRLEKCSYLRNKLNRAKTLHRSIIVELRELEGDAKEMWNLRAKEYESTIQKLTADVTWAETSAEREANKPSVKNVDEMTTKQITQQAMLIQDDTQVVASRARQMVEETIQIGTDVNAELKRQGEQIKNIQDDVDQIENNVKRANQQIRVFMRRMATDRIILLLLFLVVVGIIVAIVLFILKKQGIIKIGA